MNKIAILLPTRERPEDLKLMIESWIKYSRGLSDLIIQVDDDDPTNYQFVKNLSLTINTDSTIVFLVGKRKPFLHILNDLAKIAVRQYDYIGFMEDDCCFTQDWEQIFIDKIDELVASKGYGIVWGNDNINRDSIVGLPFMSANIIKTLGFMSPPDIKYLWADYFWKHLGEQLKCLYYFPSILIEHRHYSTGKREKCEISNIVDTKGSEDCQNYRRYYENTFLQDVERLKNAIT